MVRVVIASVVSLLALPAAAHAGSLDAKPPPKSVAGVKITWPLKANAVTVLEPGAKLSVKVRSAHRRAVVSLLRADARGIPTRLLARRTLRSGTFTAALPAGQGVLYQLRVVVNGKRYWAWVATIVPAPPKAPDPMPALAPLDCDVALPPRAEVTAMPATVHPGETVTVAVKNTGNSCMWAPSSCVLAAGRILPDGTVEAPDPPPVCATVLTLVAHPGETWTGTWTAPATPGRYRLTIAAPPNPAAEVEVVP
jgi:hypothetical protein